jgi:hypothetical protein
VRESQYQRDLIKRLNRMFPGCHIQKNDPRFVQGMPDILILHGPRWAMLEVKMDATSARQPNQDYYVEHFGKMGFASFINPAIEAEVLDELQRALGSSG